MRPHCKGSSWLILLPITFGRQGQLVGEEKCLGVCIYVCVCARAHARGHARVWFDFFLPLLLIFSGILLACVLHTS